MVLLARDPRVPKQLRSVAGIGLLPIPGPLDEAVLLLIAPVFVIFYREPMREAWQKSFRRPTRTPKVAGSQRHRSQLPGRIGTRRRPEGRTSHRGEATEDRR
jgi:hypothetical protein